MADPGTSLAPELLVELDRDSGRGLRAQLEDGLREAVRSRRVPGGRRMPASRMLAAELGVSRRLVVEAYSQLLAEGYLVSRRGAGTYVADGAAPAAPPRREPRAAAAQFDFFPGAPDLAGFPRGEWLRAMREVLRDAPDRAFGYPDPRGARALRRALTEHLRRVRGLVVEPQSIVVCSGAAEGLALLGRTLVARGARRVAVEDPGLAIHRAILAATGLVPVPVAVDEQGMRSGELIGSGADVALITPAHQLPLGVALSPERRTALLDWSASGGLLVEDDYDAEFRYDRAPLAALQGLAPERVVYLGTASKSLSPALRLGWLVLPGELVGAVAEQKLLADCGSPTLEQLALARLLESGVYDRHLRQARRRYRARRDALAAALARHLPEAQLTGLAAGLHVIVRLPRALDGAALVAAARRRSVAVYPLGAFRFEPRREDAALVLGYANLPEPALAEGVRRLALAVAELSGPRSAPARAAGVTS